MPLAQLLTHGNFSLCGFVLIWVRIVWLHCTDLGGSTRVAINAQVSHGTMWVMMLFVSMCEGWGRVSLHYEPHCMSMRIINNFCTMKCDHLSLLNSCDTSDLEFSSKPLPPLGKRRELNMGGKFSSLFIFLNHKNFGLTRVFPYSWGALIMWKIPYCFNDNLLWGILLSIGGASHARDDESPSRNEKTFT